MSSAPGNHIQPTGHQAQLYIPRKSQSEPVLAHALGLLPSLHPDWQLFVARGRPGRNRVSCRAVDRFAAKCFPREVEGNLCQSGWCPNKLIPAKQ